MEAPAAWDLECYRGFLRLQVRHMQLDPRLERRFDGSDLVQETLLKAHHRLADFRGGTEAERLKWLQEILVNVTRDKIREHTADKRNLKLEQSLQGLLEDSSARLEAWVSAAEFSPGREAERQELLLQVSAALDQLPPDQQDAISLHHLKGMPVSEIARYMNCTTRAVAGLLYRGLKKLRSNLSILSLGERPG